MRDDEDDFIEDMIAYKIIMDSEKNKRSSGQKCGSSGCFSWIVMIIIIILVIGFIGQCTGGGKKNISSTRSTYSSTSKMCLAGDCTRTRMAGSLYCYIHTCSHSGCTNRVVSGSNYCSMHQPETQSAAGNNKKAKTTKATASSSKKDPYGIEQYNDVEDFYEDWYDDFDGFDDAEQYWDDNH